MISFLSRLLNKPKIRHYLAIDLGSASIRSMGFECRNSKCLVIQKRHFELPPRENKDALIPPAMEYLHKLLLGYIRSLGRVPDKILIGFGGYFIFNEISITRQVRERPEEAINIEELHSMLDDFMTAHRNKIIDGRPLTIARLMPLRINADGYHLENLNRRSRGRTIEIEILAAYVRREYWNALTKLKSIMDGLKITFISNQAALVSALIAILNVKNALLLKIGAEITEVTLVSDGAIAGIGRFEMGGGAFTAAIADALGLSHGQAERIKRQWGKIVLPAPSAQAVKKAVLTAAAQWLNKLTEFIEHQGNWLLPQRVYILGGGARLAAIAEILASKPWYSNMTIFDHLEIRRLDAEEFSGAIFSNLSPNVHPVTRRPRPEGRGNGVHGPDETTLAAIASGVTK